MIMDWIYNSFLSMKVCTRLSFISLSFISLSFFLFLSLLSYSNRSYLFLFVSLLFLFICYITLMWFLGIDGYRNDSLETVKRNQQQYQLPLTILSYKELYGWSMDDIVRAIGKKNNCTFCGVFRRQALERGALQLGAQHIVTGHNADDIAETVLMNLLRGDISRLERCTLIQSQLLSERSQTPAATATGTGIQRSKPFKYTYEKEIVMYAYFLRLDYFSTECTYAPNAYRGTARTYLKSLEKIRPSVILDIIYAGESMQVKRDRAVPRPKEGVCERCGFVASQRVCKACVLLEGLNRGLPKLGIGRAARKVGLETEEVGERKVVEEMEKMTLKDISKEF